MSCYIPGNGTFDLKIHAVVVWGGRNFYNLDEMERELIFYKTMKKIFSELFSTWEKCVSLNCSNFCITTQIPAKFEVDFGKIWNFWKYLNEFYKKDCWILGKVSKMSSSFPRILLTSQFSLNIPCIKPWNLPTILVSTFNCTLPKNSLKFLKYFLKISKKN